MSSPLVGSPNVTTNSSNLCPLPACVQQLPLFNRISTPLLAHKRGGRLVILFVAAAVFMTILLSYFTSGGPRRSSGWLAALGVGGGPDESSCTLVCPRISPDNTLWSPRAYPVNFPCITTAKLPVPCSHDNKTSELLSQPPIQFLSNFHNPCWYEAFLPGEENPYRHNLFACFSFSAQRLLKTMAAQWEVRRKTERNPRRLRCLPYAYFAGMPKSGSTDLYRKVIAHPDVASPPTKEPHWWVRFRHGARLNFSSSVPLHDYVEIFDRASLEIEGRSNEYGVVTYGYNSDTTTTSPDEETAYNPMITVDASASTLWDNDEWWRDPDNCGRTEPLFTNAHYIRRLTPQARIIVILRSPTERLYSDYLYFTKFNKSVAVFHKHVNTTIQILNECTARRSLRSCVYDKRVANGRARVRLRLGIYHVYLTDWLKVFPPKQLLVLRTEDYSENVIQTVRRVYKFLNLRPLTQMEEKQLVKMPIANTRKTKDKKLGTMWEKTRQLLEDFYRPHNQRLAEILRDDRFLWNDVTDDAEKIVSMDSSTPWPSPA